MITDMSVKGHLFGSMTCRKSDFSVLQPDTEFKDLGYLFSLPRLIKCIKLIKF